MAVAKMEKIELVFESQYLDDVLLLMQRFQSIHIETGFESTIPPAKKTVIDKEIREIEKNIQEIQGAHSVLKGRESSKMINMLKNSGEKELSLSELTKIVEESNWEEILKEVIDTDRWLQNNRKRRKEVTKLLNELKIWENVNCNPLDFNKLNRSIAVFGSVHKVHAEDFMENLTKYVQDGMYLEKVSDDEERVHFLVFCHASLNDKLIVFMNEFSFSTEEYPFDKPQSEIKDDLEKEELQLLEDEKEIDRLIIEQSKYNEILEFAEDYNLNILLRKKKSVEVTYDGEEITILGWILADKSKQFEKLLSESTLSGNYRIFLSPIKDKDIENVPIKLNNNKIFSVYERLTEMYSMPKYNEIDPTPVMTIFYLIFFGMMVADFGYGLAIFIVGLVVRKINVKRSTKSLVDFLFYLSFPIMGWGLLYGSFCGVPMAPLINAALGTEGYQFGIIGMISIQRDIIFITILAIILGFIHILTGLVLQILNQLRVKNYYAMMSSGLAWLLALLGGAFMIIARMTALQLDTLFWVGLAFTVIGLAMTVVVPAIEYGKRWYVGVGKGLYSLYGATSYLGDFVSFTRLMALGVAGASVALAFNTILNFLPLPLMFTLGIVLAIFLHGLNLALTMLSAYVHGIRLQFIEFFGKFYQGGGKKFEPFKPAEKNVVVSDVTREN